MSLMDPIGDMFTRIRNGQMRSLNSVDVPASNFRQKILEILKTEGYIRNFFIEKKDNNKKNLKVVHITEKQAEYLDIKLGLRTTMPKDWKFGDDEFARIKLLKEAA